MSITNHGIHHALITIPVQSKIDIKNDPRLLTIILNYLLEKDKSSLGLSCRALYQRIHRNQLDYLTKSCFSVFKDIVLRYYLTLEVSGVNRDSYQIILRDLDLQKDLFKAQTLQKALSIAYSMENGLYKSKALCEIAKVQAETNLEFEQANLNLKRAIAVAKSIKGTDRDSTLYEILKVQAQINLDQAIITAKSMESVYYVDRSLYEIAKMQAKMDLDKAIETTHSIKSTEYKAKTLYHIVKMQASIDLDRAIEIADSIEDMFYKSKALCEIANEQAKIDRDKAIHTANSIENDYYRVLALLRIAKIQIKVHPEQTAAILKQAVAIARSFRNPNDKNELLIKIAKQQAQFDVDQAIDNAELIERNDVKENALRKIAKVQIRIDLDRAIAIAHSIGSYNEEEVFREIVKVQAQANFTQAYTTIHSIEDAAWRGKTFCEIAKMQIKDNPEQAQFSLDQATKSLKDVGNQEMTLCEIAILQSHFNLAQALATANSIEGDLYKAEALCGIAKVQAQIDPKEAKKIFNQFIEIEMTQFVEPAVRDFRRVLFICELLK